MKPRSSQDPSISSSISGVKVAVCQSCRYLQCFWMFLCRSYFLIKRPLKREFYGEVHSHANRTRCRIGFDEQPKLHFLASLRAFHYLIPTWLLHLTSSSSSCQVLSRNTLNHHSYQSCRYLQCFRAFLSRVVAIYSTLEHFRAFILGVMLFSKVFYRFFLGFPDYVAS